LFALKLERYIDRDGNNITNFKNKYEKATSRSIELDELKNKIMFSVVRNPYSRILAGYLDKKRGHDTTFKKQFGNRLPKNFLEFLKYLNGLDPWNIDTHFRPQYLNLAIEDLRYNYVFFFEKFNFLEQFLKSDKGISIVSARSHSTNASNLINEHYDEESIALVQKIFKKDFKYFGYSIDPNISKSKFENFLTYNHEEGFHSDCKDGILNKNDPIEQSFKLKKYVIFKELIRKKYI
jgi:hypothetical protein